MFWETVNTWYDKMRSIAMLSTPFLGFGLIRRWHALLTSAGLDEPVSLFQQYGLSVNSLFECAFLLALILLAKRFAPLYRRGAFVLGSAVLLSLGSLAALLGTFAWASPGLVVLGDVLTAFGFTTLFVVWLELYGCVSPAKIAVSYAASFVVCSAIWAIVRQLDPFSASVVVCLSYGLLDQGFLYGSVAVLAALVFAASVLVFRERDFYLQWGESDISPAAADEEARLREKVEGMAARCKFSARERDIALLMARNLSNPEIASELFVAPGTVRTHVSRIYSKLGVHSREGFDAALHG